jgi:CopG family nickel-responsive transcriptional regulator
MRLGDLFISSRRITIFTGCGVIMVGVLRFSVSTPPDLLKEFDDTIARIGYDRSKAIQHAMRNFLAEYRWKYDSGEVVGTLTIIYNHEVKGLEESLTDIQHAYRNIIISALHIHLDEAKCLLVIAVKGKTNPIRELVTDLETKRGIMQLKLTTVAL